MSVPFLLFRGPGEADWTCGKKAWGRSVAPLGSGYNLAPTSLCAEIKHLLASVCLNSSTTGTSLLILIEADGGCVPCTFKTPPAHLGKHAFSSFTKRLRFL